MSCEAWKWYVYELVDPRTDTVFYVGKGSKNRIDDHEKEALQGVCSEKTKKINEIALAGHKIGKRKVALFWDERAAYSYETERIALYGLENLTNVMPGGQGATERRVALRCEEQPRPLADWFLQNTGQTSEAVFRAFAQWFRMGLHKGGSVKAQSARPELALHDKLTELMFNRMMPTLWRQVCACEVSLERFAQRLLPYGVVIEEVQHGRA